MFKSIFLPVSEIGKLEIDNFQRGKFGAMSESWFGSSGRGDEYEETTESSNLDQLSTKLVCAII